MNKEDLRKRDICTKFITPAIVRADWDIPWQIREEASYRHSRNESNFWLALIFGRSSISADYGLVYGEGSIVHREDL